MIWDIHSNKRSVVTAAKRDTHMRSLEGQAGPGDVEVACALLARKVSLHPHPALSITNTCCTLYHHR